MVACSKRKRNKQKLRYICLSRTTILWDTRKSAKLYAVVSSKNFLVDTPQHYCSIPTKLMEKKRERDEIQPSDVAQPALKKVKLSSVEESYENAINAGVKSAKEAIEGLEIVRNFISKEEHDKLISEIDKHTWSSELKRRVQHYGYRYDYKSKSLDESNKIGDLPEFCEPLIERLIEKGFITDRPDQLIINEYTPGQGISPHVDKPDIFTDTIVSISLGSSAVMSFQRVKQPITIDLLLERNSLLVMKGKARYDWKHSIPARASDDWHGIKNKRTRRISLTFRKVILKNKK